MSDFNANDPVADLENFSAQLQQKAQRYGQFQNRLNELRVSRTSRDGRVRIEVDSNGVPTDITLTEKARGADPGELSGTINSTLRVAQAELRTEVESLAAEVIGDDGPANNIVAQYRSRFPDTEDTQTRSDVGPAEMAIGTLADDGAHATEPTAEPPHHRMRRTGSTDDDNDDDDWSGRSIFD